MISFFVKIEFDYLKLNCFDLFYSPNFHMVVEEVTGSLSSYFRKAGGSLVVVDFYAVWYNK